MEKVISRAEIIIDGVNIENSFKINNPIHQEHITSIECNKHNQDSVRIIVDIESDDKNKNYLIYLDLKEFLLRLFTLFGVNVKIDESKTSIDTTNDYKQVQHILMPPRMSLDAKSIQNYEVVVGNSLYQGDKDGEFYNLIESHRDMDITHRFRSLFATFDKIAPKQKNGHSIDYKALDTKYVDIIKPLYTDFVVVRYYEIIEELIERNIIDELHKDKINYSRELKRAFSERDKNSIINEDIAFNLLKCIQGVRNRINHGNFKEITPKAVLGSYELLLPLTQELMKEYLNESN